MSEDVVKVEVDQISLYTFNLLQPQQDKIRKKKKGVHIFLTLICTVMVQ